MLEGALRFVDAVTAVDVFAAPSAPHALRSHAALDLADLVWPAADKDLIYELRPGVRGTFVGADVKIGAAGRRGRSQQFADDGTIRVVGLGDSIAFGWGVPENATFLAQLRRRFRNAHPEGANLEVVNMGVPGYNTYQEVEAFLAQAASLRPDVVVLFLCDNDDELPNFVRKRDPYTLRRSYLADLVTGRLRGAAPELARTSRRILATRAWRTNDAALAPPAYRHMVGADAVERALTRLAAHCVEHGIPVVYAGTGGDLDARVRPMARRLGFVVVDDLAARVDAYLQRTGRPLTSLQVSASDPHPNRDNHALIAASLYDAIAPLMTSLEAHAAARDSWYAHAR
jgi:lysophospholipase L1-like esterase